jgi:hypothetical protein
MSNRPKVKTYYNRSETARILSVDRATLIRWQRDTRRVGATVYGLTLFRPCRERSELWTGGEQYHRRQVELLDRVLADPDQRADLERAWRGIRNSLGPITIEEAEELELVHATNNEEEAA